MAAEPRPPGPLALHPLAHPAALGVVTPKTVELLGSGMQGQHVFGAVCNAWGQWAALRNPGPLQESWKPVPLKHCCAHENWIQQLVQCSPPWNYSTGGGKESFVCLF